MEVPLAYGMKSFWVMSGVVILCLITPCSLPVKRPTDPKTVAEQIFMSQAIERSMIDVETGIPKGTTITLEVSGLTTDQTQKDDVTQRHVKNVIAGWLGKQGLTNVEPRNGSLARKSCARDLCA